MKLIFNLKKKVAGYRSYFVLTFTKRVHDIQYLKNLSGLVGPCKEIFMICFSLSPLMFQRVTKKGELVFDAFRALKEASVVSSLVVINVGSIEFYWG